MRELDDGRVLVHDFAGCEVGDVVAAVGMKLEDLFPERSESFATKGERRPLPASDVLRAVGFEAMVVADAASTLAAGKPLSDADRARLTLAAGRLQEAVDAFEN